MELTEMSWTECWFWWLCRCYVQASSLGNECCSCKSQKKNVVPTNTIENSLDVIYECGLIGTYT